MFDTISVLILSTIIVIIFAVASNQFHGLGFLVRVTLYSATMLIPMISLSGLS